MLVTLVTDCLCRALYPLSFHWICKSYTRLNSSPQLVTCIWCQSDSEDADIPSALTAAIDSIPGCELDVDTCNKSFNHPVVLLVPVCENLQPSATVFSSAVAVDCVTDTLKTSRVDLLLDLGYSDVIFVDATQHAWTAMLQKMVRKSRFEYQQQVVKVDEQRETTERMYLDIALALKGEIVDISDSVVELLGYTKESVLGLPVYHFVHPTDWRKILPDVYALARNQYRELAGVLRILAADGTYRAMKYSGRSDFASTESKRWNVRCRDVAVVEQKDLELRMLKIAVEQSAGMVLITNALLEIVYVNQRVMEVSGYSKEQLIGKHVRLLRSGLTPGEVYKELWTKVGRRESWTGEIQNRSAEGESYWVQASISPVVDGRNNITHYVAIEEDISLRKKAEEELMASMRAVEEMNNIKSAFLANVSHEFRTPLTGVIGFASLLKASSTDDQAEMARLIEASGHRLLRTLDSVLDLSMLEAGSVSLKNTPVKLVPMLEELVNDFAYEAELKNVQINLTTDCQSDLEVQVDRLCFLRICRHLIDNAVKFTRDGTVNVSLVCTITGDVKLQVQDTGIGIAEEFLPKLFDGFHQEELGLNRPFEGMGVGLAISKKLARMLGAKIYVESEKGIGSTFTVELPSNGKIVKN